MVDRWIISYCWHSHHFRHGWDWKDIFGQIRFWVTLSHIEGINVRCTGQYNGLLDLQKQLHVDISNKTLIQVNDISVYACKIGSARPQKRVFIMLDDIDSLDQLCITWKQRVSSRKQNYYNNQGRVVNREVCTFQESLWCIVKDIPRHLKFWANLYIIEM